MLTELHITSGGANGADTAWGDIAQEFGMPAENIRHFWHTTPTPKGNTKVVTADYDEGVRQSTIAARQMGRIAENATIKNDLIIRDWSQVKYAEAVFAIAKHIKVGDELQHGRHALIEQASGGTGYAVQMGINLGLPIYLFDTATKQWLTWSTDKFIQYDNTVCLAKHSACIGSRRIDAVDLQAIRKVITDTVALLITDTVALLDNKAVDEYADYPCAVWATDELQYLPQEIEDNLYDETHQQLLEQTNLDEFAYQQPQNEIADELLADDVEEQIKLTPSDIVDKYATYSDVELAKIIIAHVDEGCKLLSNTKGWSQERFDETQRQPICSMLYDMCRGYNIVLEAPTGAGKSIIAYFIGTFFSSYILTSDKMLQDQYDEWVKRNIINNTGVPARTHTYLREAVMLKGRDNYICQLNGCVFSQGTCQDDGLSFAAIKQTLKCAAKCQYIVTRDRAIEYRLAILNYQFWLMQMNRVKGEAFGPRVTIFDECHKIDDILQGFLDLTIGPKFIQDCSRVDELLATMFTYELQETYAEIKQQLFNVITKLIQSTVAKESPLVINDVLSELSIVSVNMLDNLQELTDKIYARKRARTPMSSHENAYLSFIAKLGQLSFELDTMLDVAHTSPNDILVVLNQDDNSLSIKCINDALLAEKLVHCNTAAQLWMSATIGDIDTYAKLNGITNYKAYSMSTNFTFDKSPIYLSKPAISLSYANIDKNLAELVSRVDAICAKYPFDNILVHTSTKRITNHLMQNVNQYSRLKTYGNAAEKQKLVSELNINTNFIVVGHSLQEGVDLYDDKCRVIIVAKLSWPSLGDLVVKTKADNHGDWYILKVFQHFVQSIGRGIRNNKDWCITYVLDSSFGRIKQQLKFTPLIAQRLIDGDDLHGHVEPTKTTEELDAIAAAAQAPPTLQF